MFWITRSTSIIALTFLCFSLAMQSSSTTAQFQLTLNPYYLYDDNRDLDNSLGTHEAGMIVKPKVDLNFNANWRGYFYGYGIYATSHETIDDSSGGDEAYVGLRELWLDWSGLTDYPGESIRVGRERLKDDDGLWTDSDISLLRWRWDTTLWKGTAGIARKIDDFENDGSPLPKDERDLLRFFASHRLQYSYHNYLEMRAMYVRGDDQSLYQPRLTWLSLGVDNDYFSATSDEALNYRLALLGMIGSDVPQRKRRDVNGWAADVGLRWRPSSIPLLAVGAQYVYASADGDGGFRATGLESNRARFTGTQASFYRFNEALRAELSNLQAIAVYTSLSIHKHWDLSLVAQQFWLTDKDADFYAAGLGVNPEGNGRRIGEGLDLVGSWYWNAGNRWPFDSYLRTRASVFLPGTAFAKDQNSLRARYSLDWVNTW
ncbi:alginate export family protein [Gynuella sp.]|uniref:alginate export family protein n=1 Tax=Gynuella sp. TaxID=2969146 RepID=UPI003D0BFBFA